MGKLLMGGLGRRAMKHPRVASFFDIGLGFALFRSKRVPLAYKAMGLALGGVATALLMTMELPLEGIIGALLPLAGLGLDFGIDGLEALAGPVLFGALCMLMVTPGDLLESERMNRYGVPVPISASL